MRKRGIRSSRQIHRLRIWVVILAQSKIENLFLDYSFITRQNDEQSRESNRCRILVVESTIQGNRIGRYHEVD